MRKVMTLSHGVTNKQSYKYMINDLFDGCHIAYFDWKFIYIYNFLTHKINFTIKTADNINGIAYLKDKGTLVSFHSGSFLGTCGINFWDIATGKNILQAEMMKNVYNLVYIKLSNCLVYDSDDLHGNNYQIRVFDIRKKMAVKTLYTPRLNVQDEILFKYDENKNLLMVKITPDENIRTDSYDCLLVTYECRHFEKVSYLPIKIEDLLGDSSNKDIHKWNLNHNMITYFKSFIINYIPGTKLSLGTYQVPFKNESDEIGTVFGSENDGIALLSYKKTIGVDNLYSLLFYDVRTGKVVAESSYISRALILNIKMLEKEQLIIIASYDSSISFLKKTI